MGDLSEFEIVPIIQDLTKVRLQVSRCNNFSTKPAAKSTGGGRLFASVSFDVETPTENIVVNFYNTPSRTGLAANILVATATIQRSFVGEIGGWSVTTPAAAGELGEEIYFRVLDFPGAFGGPSPTVLATAVPTFATDRDVYASPDSQAAMPGYDATFGLRHFHAQAMRQILTVDLPARVPNLFGGLGLAAIVSLEDADIDIPDLRQLANLDSLRMAQGALVKALAAETNEHQQEWADIAAAARERYEKIMEAIGLANTPAEADAEESRPEPPTTGGLGFGSFSRG